MHNACPLCCLLLARNVRDRRVYEGEFGCPNCRDRFPVEGGFGDLRPPPRGVGPGEGGGVAEVEEESGVGASEGDLRGVGDRQTAALRLAAALGVTSGPGLVVVSDGHRDEAPALAELVRGIEVVVVG